MILTIIITIVSKVSVRSACYFLSLLFPLGGIVYDAMGGSVHSVPIQFLFTSSVVPLIHTLCCVLAGHSYGVVVDKSDLKSQPA